MNRRRLLITFLAIPSLVLSATTAVSAAPPKVGDSAPEVRLRDLDGKAISLRAQVKRGPVAVVFLRGYPGYQCPLCTRQVAELVAKADEIKGAGGQLILVYPGTPERAREFLKDRALPVPVMLVTDPTMEAGDAYDLRWKAQNETIYPATFVVDGKGTVRYSRVSRTHGGRAPASEVIEALRSSR